LRRGIAVALLPVKSAQCNLGSAEREKVGFQQAVDRKVSGMRHQLKKHTESGFSLSSYVAVMGILNVILEQVSHALPQIKEVTRNLPGDAAVLNTGAGEIGGSVFHR
jgi:hypothetical protein